MSSSFSKITGYPTDYFYNESPFNFIHPEDIEVVQSFLMGVAQSGKDDKMLFRFKKSDGEYMWLETLASVLSSSLNTDNVLLQTSSRDVTLRKQAEIELTKALQKEKELGELKSRFVSMASHEFRTPLSTIRVGAELVKAYIDKDELGLSPRTNDKVSNKLEEIMIDVDRISELMADILTMGKIEASKVPFNPSPKSIMSFLNDYISQDSSKVLQGRILKSSLDAIDGLVLLDEKLMKQVLQNALSNAVKYSKPETQIDIKLYQQKNVAVIEIIDRGIGIPEKELNFLFESFFRATNVENIPGTGLGLSIMKLFVEMHSGEIKIDSKHNFGTTVKFTLPLI
jgi:PAS domain S-box-containing protein